MGQDVKTMVDIKNKVGVYYFKLLKPTRHIVLAKTMQVIGGAEQPMEALVWT